MEKAYFIIVLRKSASETCPEAYPSPAQFLTFRFEMFIFIPYNWRENEEENVTATGWP
jgi:hypothetical protein